MESSLSSLVFQVTDSVKYYYYDVWNTHGDPRVVNLPLMDGGPWNMILIICAYLYCVKTVGPQFMKNRKAYDLRNFILMYNLTLIAINGWFFLTGCWVTNFGIDSWKCDLVDRRSRNFIDLYKIQLGWFFLMTKFVDFFDTFFFILRKKERQISGLHVFHHSCMPAFVWIGLKFAPGGNSGFFPWINSGIHTIMYTYYAMSTFEHLKPYLWWKKYLTQIQMVQFVLVILHSFYSMMSPGCQWPKLFMYLSIFNAFLFLILFYSFFQQTYKVQQLKVKTKQTADCK
ncbi:elongation of very long chain fatty acids protein-like isoform X1 [Leptotrombidium deliense]|uniref:Elongation of very long chain fatty acids protein n=1 Tax=Leptotrombidium deliense TaxID=299467 RepID=A0A443SM96_9ACAR|nr:elongation of very long chain fatty acids protein-like isoform X1 [Leptotrombidium deliense]